MVPDAVAVSVQLVAVPRSAIFTNARGAGLAEDVVAGHRAGQGCRPGQSHALGEDRPGGDQVRGAEGVAAGTVVVVVGGLVVVVVVGAVVVACVVVVVVPPGFEPARKALLATFQWVAR